MKSKISIQLDDIQELAETTESQILKLIKPGNKFYAAMVAEKLKVSVNCTNYQIKKLVESGTVIDLGSKRVKVGTVPRNVHLYQRVKNGKR